MHGLQPTETEGTAPAWWAGAAVVEITPPASVFLFGYPHVRRMSTGVHDPLECAALYLRGSGGQALFLANDLIYVSRDFAEEVRTRIAAATGVPVEGIMVTATHTHSGPVMTNNLSNEADSVVPRADPEYLRWVGERMVTAARHAVAAAVPANVGLARARAEGVGSNRHDPAGPTDPEVPVLVAKAAADGRVIACQLIYGMHPTVLHEDSTLVTADFVGFTRQALRQGVLPPDCPVLFHQGAAGNQSPRHVTRANTLAEARRIGERLAEAVAAALPGLSPLSPAHVEARRIHVPVVPRSFPPLEQARADLQAARSRYEALRISGAPRQEVRTAECDVFGAEKTAVLAQADADGRLAAAVARASPAEIQLIQIGPWRLIGWPGEFFVEYGLGLKARAPRDTFLITLANGELQGYIATQEAVKHGRYEATNAIFRVENGERFIERTLALIHETS